MVIKLAFQAELVDTTISCIQLLAFGLFQCNNVSFFKKHTIPKCNAINNKVDALDYMLGTLKSS